MKNVFLILLLLGITLNSNAQSNSEVRVIFENIVSNKDSLNISYLSFQELNKFKENLYEKKGMEKGKKEYVRLKAEMLSTYDSTMSFLEAAITANKQSRAVNRSNTGIDTSDLSKLCVPREETILKVFFFNGMFNERDGASDSVEALKLLEPEIMQTFSKQKYDTAPKKFEYELMYNESEPVIKQLAQVVRQKLRDNYRLFWKYIHYLEESPADFQHDYFSVLSLWSAKLLSSEFNDNLGDDFHRRVLRSIHMGEIPVLISHSQGNFYANYVSEKLQNQFGLGAPDYFGNLQIASPAHSIYASNGDSILREDDLVIAWLAELAGSGEINVEDRPYNGDYSAHELVKSYLKDKEIRPKIINAIVDIYTEAETIGYTKDHIKLTVQKNSGDNKCIFTLNELNGPTDNCFFSAELAFDEDFYSESIPCHCAKLGKYKVGTSVYSNKQTCSYELTISSLNSNKKMSFSTNETEDYYLEQNHDLTISYDFLKLKIE